MDPTLTTLPVDPGRQAPAPDPGGALAGLAIFTRLSATQLLALGATGIGLMAFFAYLIFRIMEPDYGLLYSQLDLEESAEIIGQLDAMGVSHQLQGNGSAIFVPADDILRLRMSLAEQGLPRAGAVGDEIFDQTSPLGTTSFLSDVSARRALEGELARTISSLGDVKSARVHLVMPRRELFRRERIEPSASVALQMYGGRRLDSRQVAAVQHLVAAAAPGLKPERITLIDDRGTLLARGDGSQDRLPGQAEEHRINYENHLKQVIEQLLERSLGPGRVHAQVHADLDFDQVVTTEEIFDPESQVARSTQTTEEETDTTDREDDGTVTVGNNLPNAGVNNAPTGRTSTDNSTRTEETINYEVSRTVRNHTQLPGRVRRLSVAVAVGGRTQTDSDGVVSYVPLEQDELDELASLVRSAIGFDEDRGDAVEVKNLPFVEPPFEEEAAAWSIWTKEDAMRLIELAVLVAIAAMTILFIVRPVLNRLFPQPAPALPGRASGRDLALEGPNPAVALPAPGTPEEAIQRGQGDTTLVDIARVEGGIRRDLIEETMATIDTRPDDVVAVLRTWIDESKKKPDNG